MPRKFLTKDFLRFKVAVRKFLGFFVNNVIRLNIAACQFSDLLIQKLVRYNLLFLTSSQNQHCSFQSFRILTVKFIGHSLGIVSGKVLDFLQKNVIRHNIGFSKVSGFLLSILVRFNNLVRNVLGFFHTKSGQIQSYCR